MINTHVPSQDTPSLQATVGVESFRCMWPFAKMIIWMKCKHILTGDTAISDAYRDSRKCGRTHKAKTHLRDGFMTLTWALTLRPLEGPLHCWSAVFLQVRSRSFAHSGENIRCPLLRAGFSEHSLVPFPKEGYEVILLSSPMSLLFRFFSLGWLWVSLRKRHISSRRSLFQW